MLQILVQHQRIQSGFPLFICANCFSVRNVASGVLKSRSISLTETHCCPCPFLCSGALLASLGLWHPCGPAPLQEPLPSHLGSSSPCLCLPLCGCPPLANAPLCEAPGPGRALLWAITDPCSTLGGCFPHSALLNYFILII